MEAAAAGKVAAVAASAAAVAGGGYATVERTVRHEHANRTGKTVHHDPTRTRQKIVVSRPAAAASARSTAAPTAAPRINEFGESGAIATSATPSEFEPEPSPESLRAVSATAAPASKQRSPTHTSSTKVAPEFASQDPSDEFGP
jgi:hypothetical protein